MSHVASRCILRIMGTLRGTFTAVRKVDVSEGDGSILNGRSAYLLQDIISNCHGSIKAFFAVFTQY